MEGKEKVEEFKEKLYFIMIRTIQWLTDETAEENAARFNNKQKKAFQRL